MSSAKAFLEANEHHPASAFQGIEAIAEEVLGAVANSTPITIYGDYDADGVAATAILVGLIRQLGGTCDWFIPDRITEGYGLNEEALEAIAARGTGLVITVDCGVSSPAEADLAKALGMKIVITDHHQFGEVIPDCPVLHPVLSGYPFEWLSGAGVASKLASEIRRLSGGGGSDEDDLDLVALSTVADVMPLTGENRRLVRQGLNVIRRAKRIGMRALLEEARVEPATVDATDLGFRIGPRINAVGRMYRADAGVELFLSEDRERATEIAGELSAANSERRRVQQEVEVEARRALAELAPDRSAIVVAGEGWHSGVVGIVASHLARDEGMPAVVLSLEGETAKGSARSIPGVDLHAAIAENGDLLETFGGHAAAAGLTISADRIEEFRAGLDRSIRSATGGGRQEAGQAVDAFIGGQEIGATLATQVSELGPYGAGNPTPSLLVPSAAIEDPVEMGEGRHMRFSLVSGGHRARAVWFGTAKPPGESGDSFDILGELSLNHWNGSVEPRFRVIEARPRPGEAAEPLESAGSEEWWERFDRAIEGGADREPVTGAPPSPRMIEHRNSSEAVLAEVVSSGESLLVVTAEAYRRWTGLGGKAVGRFAPDGPVIPNAAWFGSPIAQLGSLGPELSLVDYETLGRVEGLDGQFENVLLFDPPASELELARAVALGDLIHRPYDLPARSFALAAAAERHDPVPALREIFRVLTERGPLGDEALRQLLSGSVEAPRSPERAAMLVRVMEQTGIGLREGTGAVREFGAVSSGEVDLTLSDEFRRQAEIHREQIEFLRR